MQFKSTEKPFDVTNWLNYMQKNDILSQRLKNARESTRELKSMMGDLYATAMIDLSDSGINVDDFLKGCKCYDSHFERPEGMPESFYRGYDSQKEIDNLRKELLNDK